MVQASPRSKHWQANDFLPGRILSVGTQKPHKIDSSLDAIWHRYLTLKIGPHPCLTDAQKRIIERDYGMTDGVVTIEVVDFGLSKPDMERPAKSQQIILLNRDEIEGVVGRS